MGNRGNLNLYIAFQSLYSPMGDLFIVPEAKDVWNNI